MRVLGFQIRIDNSWFILFALILWSFASSVFPVAAPGRSQAVYIAMGLAGTLLFFVSLVAHELSHSVVARLKGIPVAGITLFLFGGVAHTTMEAQSAGDEFQIAVVGPLMSLLIAAILWGVAAGAAALGAGAVWTAVPAYISILNVVLAIFNMLPGFPLDGGRMLRATVWQLTGDVARATRVAALCGQFLGYGLIAFGLISVLARNVIGGLWLMLIGWFLRNAAAAAARTAQRTDVTDHGT